MTAAITTNGKSNHQVAIQTLPLVTSSELTTSQDSGVKPKKVRKNKAIYARLTIDAGSYQVKFHIQRRNGEGYFDSFVGKLLELDGDLPHGFLGCFGMGDENYAVGAVVDSLNGTIQVSSDNNKLKYLKHWIVGAFTSYPGFLDEIIAEKSNRRQNNDSPYNLQVIIRVLTLSKKPSEIYDILKSPIDFVYEGYPFQINFINISHPSNYLVGEGYGASCEASKALLQNDTEFDVLDFGGGTLTHSTYKMFGGKPSLKFQMPISGGGMKSLLDIICNAISKTDRGAIYPTYESVTAALSGCIRYSDEDLQQIYDSVQKKSKKDFDKWREKHPRYNVPYRHANQFIDISREVDAALSMWVATVPGINGMMRTIATRLRAGIPLYCSGGGFTSPIVADWLKAKLCEGIQDARFQVLENPQYVSVAGAIGVNEYEFPKEVTKTRKSGDAETK